MSKLFQCDLLYFQSWHTEPIFSLWRRGNRRGYCGSSQIQLCGNWHLQLVSSQSSSSWEEGCFLRAQWWSYHGQATLVLTPVVQCKILDYWPQLTQGPLWPLWPRGLCGCVLYGVKCLPDLINFFKVHSAYAALSQIFTQDCSTVTVNQQTRANHTPYATQATIIISSYGAYQHHSFLNIH